MTKKDYELIAEVLRDSRPHGPNGPGGVWMCVVEKMAMALKADNKAFQFHKFYRACGYPEI